MSRFKALQKMLGVVGDDAAKVLEKIDNPELATSLKGQERAEYLQALDEVYGPQSKRAKDMGFGDETFLHGTRVDFDKFDLNKARPGTAGTGIYFGEKVDRGLSHGYASGAGGRTYPVKLKNIENMLNFDAPITNEDIEKIKKYIDPSVFKYLKNNKDLEHGNSIRNVFRRISTEYADGGTPPPLDLISKDMKISGIKTPGREVTVYNPENIRSIHAAFDPRFKDSALLMAGAGAIPQADINPMEALKGIKENIAEPVVEKYNKLKSYVTRPLARQMNLSKDPEIEKGLKQGLDMGLDPVNLIPGGAGIGAGLFQLLGERDEEE